MNKYNVKISEHARQRAYERFNMDASQLKFYSNKALDEGIDVFQDEALREMFLEKSENKNPSGIYLFEGVCYVFSDDVLVTVYPLSFVNEYISK